MLRLHAEIQKLPAEPGCDLPHVAAALMFSSDGAQVAQFSTTNIHPIYCFFCNQSKYEWCKPSNNTCFDIAHIPPVCTFLGLFGAILTHLFNSCLTLWMSFLTTYLRMVKQ